MANEELAPLKGDSVEPEAVSVPEAASVPQASVPEVASVQEVASMLA